MKVRFHRGMTNTAADNLEVRAMAISKMSAQAEELDTSKFPYRFLLRWTWPDHIEYQLRRLIWVWLSEIQEESSDTAYDGNKREYLSDYVAMQLLWLIVIHPETSGAVLDFIARQPAQIYAERIAENPSTWASTLSHLSVHENPDVRVAVAQNPNTSLEICEELCFDESPDVRFALAECLHHEGAHLDQLIEDEHPFIASRARKTKMRMNPPKPLQMPTKAHNEATTYQLKRAQA